MEIRTAAPQDLPAVTRLEALCFPPAEAAPEAAFRDRLAACPQTCWLLWEGDTLLAMVNGMTVQTPDLTDAMYETTALHDPAGPWLMIFGVDTHPDHRRRGYAGRLLRHAIQAARDQGRAGVVLTCKENVFPGLEPAANVVVLPCLACLSPEFWTLVLTENKIKLIG